MSSIADFDDDDRDDRGEDSEDREDREEGEISDDDSDAGRDDDPIFGRDDDDDGSVAGDDDGSVVGDAPETGMITQMQGGDAVEWFQPIRIRQERPVSPSDQQLVESIVQHYRKLNIKKFDPKEIAQMTDSERYQIALENELVDQSIQEIIDLNIPVFRGDAPRERKHIVGYTYEPGPIRKEFIFQSKRNLDAKLAGAIFDVIWATPHHNLKKIDLLSRVLFQIDPDTPGAIVNHYGLENYQQVMPVLNNFLTAIHQDARAAINGQLYFNMPPPMKYKTPLLMRRKPIVKEFPASPSIRARQTQNFQKFKYSPAAARENILRLLIHALVELSIPDVDLDGCDVVTLRNCSHAARKVLPPYMKMAKYINDALWAKYRNHEDYIAHAAVLLLHLDRETPVGFYSTQFQYDIFANPSLAVTADYDAQIYPAVFRVGDAQRRAMVYDLARNELRDAYTDLQEQLMVLEGMQAPVDFGMRSIERVERQRDLDRLMAPHKKQYELVAARATPPASRPTTPTRAVAPTRATSPVTTAKGAMDKVYSITLEGVTHLLQATDEQPDELFEEADNVYMIRYFPLKNTYTILKFKVVDDSGDDTLYEGSFLGREPDVELDLPLKDRTHTLDEITDTFLSKGFLYIRSEEFEERPKELADIFTRPPLTIKEAPTFKKAPKFIKPVMSDRFGLTF